VVNSLTNTLTAFTESQAIATEHAHCSIVAKGATVKSRQRQCQ